MDEEAAISVDPTPVDLEALTFPVQPTTDNVVPGQSSSYNTVLKNPYMCPQGFPNDSVKPSDSSAYVLHNPLPCNFLVSHEWEGEKPVHEYHSSKIIKFLCCFFPILKSSMKMKPAQELQQLPLNWLVSLNKLPGWLKSFLFSFLFFLFTSH